VQRAHRRASCQNERALQAGERAVRAHQQDDDRSLFVLQRWRRHGYSHMTTELARDGAHSGLRHMRTFARLGGARRGGRLGSGGSSRLGSSGLGLGRSGSAAVFAEEVKDVLR